MSAALWQYGEQCNLSKESHNEDKNRYGSAHGLNTLRPDHGILRMESLWADQSRVTVDFNQSEAMRRQLVTYSTRARVLAKSPGHVWVEWKGGIGHGPWLIVRTESVEIVADHRRSRQRRDFIFAGDEASVRRDRIGRVGYPIGRRKCLKITVSSGMQFAVSPEADIDEAWRALAAAGVRRLFMFANLTQPNDGLPSGIRAPAARALTKAGYTDLQHLAGVPTSELERLRGVGPKTLRIIQEQLQDRGLSLG